MRFLTTRITGIQNYYSFLSPKILDYTNMQSQNVLRLSHFFIHDYCRYLGSNEAAMTILGLDRSGHHPTIITLDIHMEGGRQFVFNPDTTTYSSLNESSPSKSKLEAFFQLCSNDLFATTLKYQSRSITYGVKGNGNEDESEELQYLSKMAL